MQFLSRICGGEEGHHRAAAGLGGSRQRLDGVEAGSSTSGTSPEPAARGGGRGGRRQQQLQEGDHHIVLHDSPPLCHVYSRAEQNRGNQVKPYLWH
jgi:hypothetical protein